MKKKIEGLEGGAKFLVNVADFGPLVGLGQVFLLLHGTLERATYVLNNVAMSLFFFIKVKCISAALLLYYLFHLCFFLLIVEEICACASKCVQQSPLL